MRNAYDKSERLYRQALKYMPGGVNSPVRAFQAVGGSPIFIVGGEGALLTDVDGNTYLDYVGSWGPLILGHRPAQVIQALQECLANGTSFGAPTEAETQLAQMIVQALPGMDMVRLVNSGTEATMSAVRLARGYTGRDKIIKFAGCYHGHADFLLIKAGSGALTLGTPTSPGIPEDTAKHTIVAPYNHLERLKDIFAQIGEEIAAVIIEPIAGNMGVVPPIPGFLDGLRELTAQYGTLLIFDEVMTGFRVAYGGAQKLYGIEPDLTTLGKIIGGGLPVGAYAGKQEIMSCIAPAGPIYQAGTLSGNPLAVTAGLAALRLLNNPRVYQELEQKSARLEAGLRIAAKEAELDLVFNRVGSMLGMFFSAGPVVDYDTAAKSDTAKYAKYFRGMLNKGIYLAPSQFEAVFMSLAHTDEQIDYTIEAAREMLGEIRDA